MSCELKKEMSTSTISSGSSTDSASWTPTSIIPHLSGAPMNVYTRLHRRKKSVKKEHGHLDDTENNPGDLDNTPMDYCDEETDYFDEEKRMQSADYAILRPSSSKAWEMDVVGTFEKNVDPYLMFLHAIPCYDLAPFIGSVAILDSNLTLHLSFVSLTESEQHAALVWDNTRKGIVGMLTHTDFLEALLHAESADDLHNRTLGAYFSELASRKPLVTVNVTTNLWDVARRLLEYHVHRVPVMELAVEGLHASEFTEILFMVTLKDIFSESLMKQLATVGIIAPYMTKRIDDQRIGTWQDIHAVTENADLRSAVRLFLQKGLTSLPVLDENKQPKTVLTKHDVINLVAAHEQSTYKQVLNMPISAAIACRIEEKTQPFFCSPSITIGDAIKQLLQDDQVQCLFALDDQSRIVAAVSIADLMSFILSSAHTSNAVAFH